MAKKRTEQRGRQAIKDGTGWQRGLRVMPETYAAFKELSAKTGLTHAKLFDLMAAHSWIWIHLWHHIAGGDLNTDEQAARAILDLLGAEANNRAAATRLAIKQGYSGPVAAAPTDAPILGLALRVMAQESTEVAKVAKMKEEVAELKKAVVKGRRSAREPIDA